MIGPMTYSRYLSTSLLLKMWWKQSSCYDALDIHAWISASLARSEEIIDPRHLKEWTKWILAIVQVDWVGD